MNDNQAPASAQDYCLWGEEEFGFKIGLIGTGAGVSAVLDLVASGHFEEYLPLLKLTAVSNPGPNQAALIRVHKLEAPIYAAWEEMLDKHPEINLLVELTRGQVRRSQIQAKVGDRVSIIDHHAAIFFCGIHNLFLVSKYSQANLRRRKELYEAVLDEIQEDILLLDLHGNVVDMNRNISQRKGASKEELLGKPCWEVQSFDAGAPFCAQYDEKCPVRTTLATREKAEALVTRVGADGRLRYYRVYSYPVRAGRGELTNVLVMRRDITSRTQREKEQQEKDRFATLGEMAMYLAHEIRNPLFAIAGFAKGLLNQEGLPPKAVEKIHIISEETQRLDAMLTSILRFTRPSQVALNEVDISLVVAETLELMQYGYAGRGYEFELNCASGLPKVKADPDMLKQSLINLLKNALEAMPQGGLVIVSTGREEDMVFVRVRDTGVGMNERDIEKAFSPFYTTKRASNGYGLGLPMIKKMVEEIGGHIDLQSQPNAGATVTLYFPPAIEAVTAERTIVSI
jgi:PAS domain S-box-containing protein